MEELGNLFHGFAVALQPFNIMVMFVGITLGVLIGVLPGLGGANGVAILLPLTFSMSPTSAIIMLSCIYWGALFGGAITSILFNIPGEPWSVATTFDGHPMARQGKAGEALTAAFTSSFVGALFAVIMITLVAPLVASFALKFGPAEQFSVYFLAFCSFVGMSKEAPAKTVAAMFIGFALAAVGLDQVTGQLRLTFGFETLLTGFDFLIAVIGLFGIGEILLSIEEGLTFRGGQAGINPKVVLQTWARLPRYWATSLRSCIIGCWMGISPAGATPASFMSYGIAKRTSALAHRRRAARRPADLGPAARPAAVRRAEGIRLGPDRLDVSRQYRRPPGGADLRAAVRRDPAHPVCHHRAAHPRDLCDRRLHGAQQRVRRRADAGLRRARLHPEEMQLPARATGPRDRARRQGRGELPPVAARLAGKPVDLLVQWARQHDHGARADRAVVAADPDRLDAHAPRDGRLTKSMIPKSVQRFSEEIMLHQKPRAG
jgi:hypothetical protein